MTSVTQKKNQFVITWLAPWSGLSCTALWLSYKIIIINNKTSVSYCIVTCNCTIGLLSTRLYRPMDALGRINKLNTFFLTVHTKPALLNGQIKGKRRNLHEVEQQLCIWSVNNSTGCKHRGSHWLLKGFTGSLYQLYDIKKQNNLKPPEQRFSGVIFSLETWHLFDTSRWFSFVFRLHHTACCAPVTCVCGSDSWAAAWLLPPADVIEVRGPFFTCFSLFSQPEIVNVLSNNMLCKLFCVACL